MAVATTGNTFASGDQVTATKLNNIVNAMTFDSTGAVDNSTTQLSGGAIIVKDAGITPAKLSTGGPSWDSNGNTVLGGTTTNDSAAAGKVGEVNSAYAASSTVSLTNATSANLTSISLTAGDWDVYAMANFAPASASTVVTDLWAGLSSTSATLPTEANGLMKVPYAVSTDNSSYASIPLFPIRVSVASTTTYYLVGRGYFSVSGLNGGGLIRARRAR